MAFDICSGIRLPPSTSLAEAEALVDRLLERIAELPGVALHARYTDTGPERPDMSHAERALLVHSQRVIPYSGTGPPLQTVKTTIGGMTALMFPQLARPTLVTTSPRLAVLIDVAPGCTPLWCYLGYLDPALVPVAPPGLEAMYRSFCPPGWKGVAMVMTETALEGRDGGIPNAVAAHLAAIGVLDRMREVGFRMTVSDQGDFHTDRDLKHLVRILDRVRSHRIAQGNSDIKGLLKRLSRALGREGPQVSQVAGPTRRSAARLAADPDAARKAQAEERILELLRVVDRTPRAEDHDEESDAANAILGL